MKRKEKDCYVIEPNWLIVGFLLIGIIIVLYALSHNLRSNLPRYNFSILYIPLIAVVLFVFGRKYILHSEGITVCFLGIRIQTVYWYDVREVFIILQQKWGQSDDRAYIFRNGSPYAGRDIAQIESFSFLHPFDVLSFQIPDKKAAECTDAFQKFYGQADSIIVMKRN